MRVLAFAILAIALLTSCVSNDLDERTKNALTDGWRNLGALVAASVQYRDQNGHWPGRPSDVKALLADPTVVERAERAVAFRAQSRGLAFVDPRTGEAAFIVANESTPKKVVLVGGRG